MRKAKADMLIYAILMSLCLLFYFWFIPSQVRVTQSTGQIFTSRTFPRFLVAALFLVALIGFCGALYQYITLRRREKGREAPAAERGGLRTHVAPVIAFALIMAYALLFQHVGFLPASLLFIPAFLALFRCKKWIYYAGAYGFCGAMYLVFVFILGVPLR